MPALSELHHLFIQSCMSHRAMSEKTAEIIYAKCVKACQDRDALTFKVALEEVNPALEKFGFQIRSLTDEHTAKAWLAFVNTKSDKLAEVATEYNPQEIAYFRTLIKLIMKSGRKYAIDTKEATRAGESNSVQPNLKATQAAAALATYVAKGWLVVIPVGSGRDVKEYYQLSSRSRMELEYYLGEEYPNRCNKEAECKSCDTWVMKGSRCATAGCKTRFHDHCFRVYLARKGGAQKKVNCPVCKQPWIPAKALTIGPEAEAGDDESDYEESDDEGDENANKSQAGKKGKGPARTAANEEEDDEEEEEEEEPAQPEASTSRRASKNNAGGSKANGASTSRKSGATEAGNGSRKSSKSGGKARAFANEDSEEEEKAVPTQCKASEEKEEEEDEDQDQLEPDDEDEDDPLAARRAASKKREAEKKKKRKAAQMG